MCKSNLKQKLAEINFKDDLVACTSQLFMSENYSDVIFIVGDQKIPAHKCVLGTANEYFQKLFHDILEESNHQEIELKVPFHAFKTLLRFIYTGQMCLLDEKDEIVVEILDLAHMFGLKKLEFAIIEYFKEAMAINNVCAMFNVARLCEMEDLIKACYTFIDANAIDVLAHESFMHLTEESLQQILCRSSFLAPEFQIFTVVNGWCAHNPTVDIESILSGVRLPLMTVGEHIQILKTGMIKAEKLMAAMEDRNTSKYLQYRVWPEINMASLKYRSKVIQGKWETDSPLCDVSTYDLEGGTPGAITADPEIIVRLGIASIINCIEFVLEGSGKYSYVVKVSENQSEWTIMADYAQYECKHLQYVHFPPRYVKYIKLTGTKEKVLTITSLKALYKEKIPKVINGFPVSSFLVYGIKDEQSERVPIFSSKKSAGRRVINMCFNQPHYVDTLRLLLNETTNSSDIDIRVSTDQDRNWQCLEVTAFENGNWMEVAGKPFPLVYLKFASIYKGGCRTCQVHMEKL